MTTRFVLGFGLAVILLHQAGMALLVVSGFPPRASIAVAAALFLMFPLWRVLRIAGVPVRESLRWTPATAPVTVWAVLGFLAALPAVLAVTERTSRVPDTLEQFFGELLRADSPAEWVVVLLVAAVIPAVAEESLFRGFLQRALERSWGRWPAIVATALAFGAIHGIARAPTAVVLGILLGWIAARTDSLAPVILAHAAANAAAVGAANAGDALTGGADPVPWALAGTFAAISAGWLLLLARATRRSGPIPIPEDAPSSLHRERESDRPAPQ